MNEVKLLPCIEEVWRVADLIRHAEVNTPLGPRSVGYYLSVGLDHFNHPHDRFQELLNAAANAVLKDTRPTTVVTDEVVERVKLAIWREDHYDPKLCGHGGDGGDHCAYCEPHDDDTPDDWPADNERAERQARAALASMPTVVTGE